MRPSCTSTCSFVFFRTYCPVVSRCLRCSAVASSAAVYRRVYSSTSVYQHEPGWCSTRCPPLISCLAFHTTLFPRSFWLSSSSLTPHLCTGAFIATSAFPPLSISAASHRPPQGVRYNRTAGPSYTPVHCHDLLLEILPRPPCVPLSPTLVECLHRPCKGLVHREYLFLENLPRPPCVLLSPTLVASTRWPRQGLRMVSRAGREM